MDYCNGMMYTVKNGDTLYSISMKYNIPLALLLRANPYVDVYNLQAGETICLPVKREQGCQYTGDDRGIWERGENMEETGMENASGEGRSWRENRRENAGEETVTGRDRYAKGVQQERSSMEDMTQEMIEERRRESSETENRTGRESMGTTPGNRETCDGCRNMSGMDRGMDIEQTMNMEDGDMDDHDNIQWERYVTQPGDTLDIVMGGINMAAGEDMDDVLEDFVEKNGLSQIYLLPGIVYYRQK